MTALFPNESANRLATVWQERNAMTKWELKNHRATIDGDGAIGDATWQQLQILARDGWELVSVTPFRFQTYSSEQTAALHLLYTFKRPIEQ
jgi:hypothetical protein